MAQRARGNRTSEGRRFTPYGRPDPEEEQTLPRGGSFSTISPAPPTPPPSATPGPLPLQTLPSSGADNPPANAAVQPAPSRKLVPQEEYTPPRTHQAGFTPEVPIEFSAEGVPGFSISQAVDENYVGLDMRDEEMDVFKNATITCRMQFANHGPYMSKVNTHDHSSAWKPIQRNKLAREIGKKVKQYVEREGYEVPIDRLYLTRLVHVSKGSWQPELFCDDVEVTPSLTV